MRDLARRTAAFFRLDDGGWVRHANPWSGWTRFATLPLLAMAVWSRVWLGWWAMLPAALALLWIWLNPRAFPPARSDRSWMTRAVLGERIWTGQDRKDTSAHAAPLRLWAAVGGLGVPVLAWGLWALDPVTTVLGIAVIMAGKLVFCGYMVRLYDETVAARPELRYRAPAPASRR